MAPYGHGQSPPAHAWWNQVVSTEERLQKRSSSADFNRRPRSRFYRGFDSSRNNTSNEIWDLLQSQVAPPKDVQMEEARASFYPRGRRHTGKMRDSEAVQKLMVEDEVEQEVRPLYVPEPAEVITSPPPMKSGAIVQPDCWTYGCPSGYQHTGGTAMDIGYKQRVLHEGGVQFGSPGYYGRGAGWWTPGTSRYVPQAEMLGRSASDSAFHRKGCDGPLNNRSNCVRAVAFENTQPASRSRKVGGNGIHGPISKWGDAMLRQAVPDNKYGAYHYK